MNDVQSTQTSQSSSADVPPPQPDTAPPKSDGATAFSLDGFLGDSSTESHTVKGQGGYVYEQHADGSITIVEGPKNKGKTYPVGDPVNTAITAEIAKTNGSSGASPAPAAASPAPAAPAPAPAAPAPAAPAPAKAAPASSGLIPSLDDIVASIGGVATAIGDAVDSAVGTVESFFGGGEAAPAPAPAATTPAPTDGAPAAAPAAPTAAAPATTSPDYLDQRDNTWNKDGVSGDNMCSVTSLSMQLTVLCSSQDEAKKQTADLVTKHGGKPAADLANTQLEDLLMSLFDLLAGQSYWDQFNNSKAAPFYEGWRAGVPDAPSRNKFHQAGVCQAHVLAMYNGVSSKNVSQMFSESKAKTIQEFLERDVKPDLDAGATVSISTKLTGGHVAVLLSVDPDGVVIQDPYGAKWGEAQKGGYLRNNTDASDLKDPEALAVLAVRFRGNPTLLEALQNNPGKVRGDWGDHSYFTWAEVALHEIGSKATVAGKA